MNVIHLGGNRLGDRVHAILADAEGDVPTVTTLNGLEEALGQRSFDWMVSAGFGHVVPAKLLARVDNACNVHTSLLPWGRGAHPNVWMIVDHEPAGVSIHEMVPTVDAGPVFVQREIEISFADDAKDVYKNLENAAVDLFAETWPRLRNREVTAEPQSGGGSYHRSAELEELADIDLDDSVTWRRALDVLRALTFPPHQNLVVEVEDRRYHVEINLTALDGQA